MSQSRRPDVERLPADLDRFLAAFFDSGGWQAEIKFDPAADLLFLDVRLETGQLLDDDRFFSLVEHFARTQARSLRRAAGLSLRCRLYAVDGADLTGLLHQRAARYLDDDEHGATMRRRLAWLGFRRRFVRAVLPGAALWAGAFAIVTGVIGLSLPVAVALGLGALALQALATSAIAARRR